MLQFKDTVSKSNIDGIQLNLLMISIKDLKRDDIKGYEYTYTHMHGDTTLQVLRKRMMKRSLGKRCPFKESCNYIWLGLLIL